MAPLPELSPFSSAIGPLSPISDRLSSQAPYSVDGIALAFAKGALVMNKSTESSCGSKRHCCSFIFAVAHIAILTCLSMAVWKAAWALEAMAEHGH